MHEWNVYESIPLPLCPPPILHWHPIICYTEFFNTEKINAQISSVSGHYAAPAISCSRACSLTLTWYLIRQTGHVIQSLCSNAATHGFLNFMNEFHFKQYTVYVLQECSSIT